MRDSRHSFAVDETGYVPWLVEKKEASADDYRRQAIMYLLFPSHPKRCSSRELEGHAVWMHHRMLFSAPVKPDWLRHDETVRAAAGGCEKCVQKYDETAVRDTGNSRQTSTRPKGPRINGNRGSLFEDLQSRGVVFLATASRIRVPLATGR